MLSFKCIFTLQYGYQDQEERSLNLVDGNMYPASSSRVIKPRPSDLDKDTRLLQDLMSLLLSTPAQPTTRHRVATPLSTSPFFQGLDFPLDYSKDYVSQDTGASSQEQKKKSSKEYRPGDEGEYILDCGLTEHVSTENTGAALAATENHMQCSPYFYTVLVLNLELDQIALIRKDF